MILLINAWSGFLGDLKIESDINSLQNLVVLILHCFQKRRYPGSDPYIWDTLWMYIVDLRL